MYKVIRKMLSIVISASVVCSMAVAVSADKTERFSGVKLGNYEMSGELIGTLTGGYATTRCNRSVYYISVDATGYIIYEIDGQTFRMDFDNKPCVNYNYDLAYTVTGGQYGPNMVKTGSYWSSHEIRDGVNGVGKYLATIDV